MIFLLGFWWIPFIRLKMFLLYIIVSKSRVNFIECFFCIFWDGHMVIWSVNMVIYMYTVLFCWFFKFYLFIFRERGGREKERERNINVWLPLPHTWEGTWPATQACSLTGNWTSNPLVCRLVLNPLSHQDFVFNVQPSCINGISTTWSWGLVFFFFKLLLDSLW